MHIQISIYTRITIEEPGENSDRIFKFGNRVFFFFKFNIHYAYNNFCRRYGNILRTYYC